VEWLLTSGLSTSNYLKYTGLVEGR